MTPTLTAAQRALFDRLRAGSGSSQPVIPPAPDPARVPLTYAQERIWLSQQLVGDPALYHLVVAARVPGGLDAEDLHTRVARLAERHDTMRVGIYAVDGEPFMRRVDIVDFSVVPLVVAPAPGESLPDACGRTALALAAPPYELAEPPLWRVGLAALPDGDALVVLTTHHLIADGPSLEILGAGLAMDSVAPPLSVGYCDYAAWRRSPDGGRTAEHDDWWVQHLATAPEPLELPGSRSTGNGGTLAGGTVHRSLDPATADAVRDLVHQTGSSPFLVLTAALAMRLRGLATDDRMLLGLSVTDRRRPETAGLVGVLMNVVPLTVDLSGTTTLAEAVGRMTTAVSTSVEHAETTWERLPRLLRDAGLTMPPIQVCLNQPVSGAETSRRAERLELPIVPVGSQFGLTLHVVPGNDGVIALQAEHADAVLDDARAGDLLEDVIGICRRELGVRLPVPSAVRTDDRGGGAVVSRSSLPEPLPEPEPEPGPGPELRSDRVTDLIEQQARRTPLACAVEHPDGSTATYADLVDRARRVAAQLADHRLPPGSVVATALPRDAELLPTLVGVWLAGHGYLPVDPGQSVARWEQVLAEGRPAAVLLGADVPLPVPTDLPVLRVADLVGGPDPDRPVGNRRGPHPADLAYAILTSGSTGRPKVAAVTQLALANRLRHGRGATALRAGDRVLQKTRLSFDAAGWELFAPLVAGATVQLAAPGVESDPDALYAEVVARRPTVLQAVPTVLRLLVDAAGPHGRLDLRLVCSAGEPLDGGLCRRLTEHGVGTIQNTYGPSECAIDVTAHPWSSDDGDRVPIGTPIDGVEVRAVGPDLAEADDGTEGELWLSGAAVGRGYLNRPDLTAAAFVPDPWGPPGARTYRSGDLGRRDPDGTLHYVGRADDQVKINGVRVEPREVAEAIQSHPGVVAAAVLADRDDGGRPVLSAFVVGPADLGALRSLVRDRLPTAFVPTRWHQLAALPQTSSGKLDRSALLALPLRPARSAPTSPALSPAHAAVAAIWQDLLPGVPAPRPDDDFFAAGGHSLLLGRLAVRLSRVAGHDIGVAELFTATTLDQQARLLEAPVPTPAPTPARPTPDAARWPLSAVQARLWFLHQLEPESTQYLVPWVSELPPGTPYETVRRALDALASRHAVLRTRFADRRREPYAVVYPSSRVELGEHAPSAGDLELEVRRLLERPFDLAVAPWRADLVRTSRPGGDLLVVGLHHIVCDGLSLQILAAEFAVLLTAEQDRRPAELPPPGDFAVELAAERERRADGGYAQRLTEWRAALDGAVATELPGDRPRPPVWDAAGAVARFDLPADVVASVEALGRRHGATTFMTWLALAEILLWRRGSTDEVVVGTPVAARLSPNSERTVGPLANTVVLRTRFAHDADFGAVLAEVRRCCLWAWARQDVGFEDVVEVLQPPRDLSRNPLFQVMVETEGLPAFGHAALTTWNTAKFDLTIGFAAGADGGMRGYLEYATALFDPTTIEQFGRDLAWLAASVAEAPERPVGRHRLPVPAAVLTLDLGPGPGPVPAGTGPREAVAVHARLRGDTIAIQAPGQTLDYAALDQRTRVAADRLRRLGVAVGDVVGVQAERGAEVVIALLALLELGAAYVPVQPDHPLPRRREVLGLAAASLVLVDGGAVDDLGRPTVDLAQICAPGADPGTTPVVLPDRELAYVIFTSGSTGQPKGVLIDRGAYRDHCAVIARAYRIEVGSRIVQLSSLVFDVAMDQIGATLAAGATLVVAGSSDWEPRVLADRLGEHRVTTMEITPAHYRELLRTSRPGDPRLRSLDLVNVGSDLVTGADAQAWYDLGLPGVFLCNYGPTEATVTCTLHPVSAAEAASLVPQAAVPIGRPVPGTTARVLDRWLEPVAPGAVGELYLGGGRLARGYAGRGGLTADRFVPDPYGPAGARLYRTGDAVRLAADGVLHFLGRLDRQVKVRGFRIEPGEIEARLLEHPAVQAVAVVADPGADALTAYVVATAGIEPGALRDHLAVTLPQHLVPTGWVALDALPLTDSGKVDRGRLARAGGRRLQADYRPPDGPVAEQLAELWAALLEVERIGLDDDFFLLGGHSLLAVRVVAEIAERFGVELGLRTLFERSTLGGLAGAVKEAVEASVAELSDDEVRRLLAEEAG